MWRKKSADKLSGTAKIRVEELNRIEHEKEELETVVSDFKNKLSEALTKIYTQDDLIKKHEMMSADSMSGWEDAEAKVFSLKQELDEAFLTRAAREERMVYLETALKDCTQQLHRVREDQENRIHDAVMKTAKEWERSEQIVKQKLEESDVMVAKLSGENSSLRNALVLIEKSAEKLGLEKDRLEVEYQGLASKLESIEKDNASLSYELRLLQKEVEIRNEERGFNQKIADSSHKKHLESAKKVAKLEAECQRLRVLVRKRLPGPAALAKMKSEVQILEREGIDSTKRRVSSSNPGNESDAKISLLKEQLWSIEEENKFLKEALNRKKEIRVSDSPRKLGLSQHAKSDISVEDSVNSGDSWTSALILELEQFKSGNQCGSPSGKTMSSVDINLMDDFVEVERFATLSTDKQNASRRSSSVDNSAFVKESDVNEFLSEGKNGKPDWLRSVVKIIDQQHRVTSRELHLLLDDVRSALNLSGSESLCKIIKMIESFVRIDGEDEKPDENFQVFEWKASELRKLLEDFLEKCSDYLNGKCNCDNFVEKISEILEWMITHFMIKNANESGSDTVNQSFKNEKILNSVAEEKSSGNGNLDKSVPDEENQKLKSETSSRLEIIKAKLNDSRLTLSCLDEEHEHQPAPHSETQNQLESVKEAISVNGLHREEKPLRTDLDISIASEKLAQCQQTIVKLGKQLEGMTSSSTMEPLNEKVVSGADTSATICEDVITEIQSKPEIKAQSTSLMERMREEERVHREKQTRPTIAKQNDKYPRSKLVTNEVIDHLERILMLDKNEASNNSSKAIVQKNKKTGVSLWKRLFWRRRRSTNKKPRLPFSQ